MKEVTKEVILDLLPMYLAGEVSAETAALVKKYLEADPELAETAKEMAKADSLNKVPIPFRKEAAMEIVSGSKKMDDDPHPWASRHRRRNFICVLSIVFALYDIEAIHKSM